MKTQMLLLLLLAFCFQTCKQTPEVVATPEEVARKWQALVDKNQFKEARELSTKRAKDMIDLIESMLFEGDDEAALGATKFLEMECKEQGEKAICRYIIQEEGERIVDSFRLVKKSKKWLVDIPDEVELLEDDPMDDLFNQYEKSLDQALKEK